MKNLFFRLIKIHNRVEARLRLEELRPNPRDFLILRLRRVKVKVRERLDYLLTPRGMVAPRI